MNHSVSRRVDQLRSTAVNSILAEVRELEKTGRPTVSLMRGEPDFATPPHIVAAAGEALAAGRTRYPDNRGEPRLREAIARRLQRDLGTAYDPEQEILVTSGATLGIWAAFGAVVNPGDEVLLPDPIYDAYHGAVTLFGGVPKPVPARRNGRYSRAGGNPGAARFTIDAEDCWNACTRRTRALLVNTPWNPTGSVLSREELAPLVRLAETHGLLLISDEIYEAITFDEHRHTSPASLGEAGRRHTVIVNSFSKTYAMTGWRLGYCAGPARWIQAMYRVLQQASRGPATFVQDAGLAALEGPQDCVAEMRAEYARRRQRLLATLGDVENVQVFVPEGGFFALLDVSRLGDSQQVRQRLLHEFGVVCIHGAAYGNGGEGTLRISLAAGGEAFEQALAELRSGLAAMPAR